MKIITSADLGGLGAREGVPVTCQWVVPSVAPSLLPWLAILVLLMLKPNRCGAAWWIWAPLVAVNGLIALFGPLLPSSVQSIFSDIFLALTFGLAAVWLLGNHLGRRGRFLAFLSTLTVFAVAGVVAFVGRHGLEIDDSEAMPFAIMVGANAIFVPAALLLSARFCRKNYGRLKLTLWLAGCLLLAWTALIIPFAMIESGGRVSIFELFIPTLIVTGLSFGTLLPFLILSFANAFYHDRLKSLLRLNADALPPVMNTASPELVVNPVDGK